MAHQSLYRRYRPQRFSELRGQEHLVRALQHAVQTDTVGHAYLFSGPRGTGKTSTARILAKVLNCENPVDGEPDGTCDSCLAIEHGTSFDVHELDAASNNGVDAIRELVAKASLGTPGRTKVYILDEVHMLSQGASNALLKTLEEPPDHVVFVLATTDPQKVLATIRSRTQHFEVHLLSADELAALASFIIEDAGLEVPPGAVDYVVKAGAGSARDMESALDQVVAAGTLPEDGEALDELVEALCERDTGRALLAVDAAIASGRAPRQLGELLIGRLRDVFLAAMKADLARLPDRDRERVTEQASRLGPGGATRALEVLGEAFVGIQDAPDQRIPLEVALVRLTRDDADTSLPALVDRVTRLERAQSGAAPAPAIPPTVPAAAAPPAQAAPSPAPEPLPAPVADAPVVVAESAAAADDTPPWLAERADAAPSPAVVEPAAGGPAASARQALAAKKAAPSPTRAARAASRRPADAPPAAPAPASVAAEVAPAVVEPDPPVPSADPEPALAAEPDPVVAESAPAVVEPTPPPAEPAEPAASAAASSGLPTRDELTLAWGDSILGSLPPRAKAFFGGGRFIDVTDRAAVFGLPTAVHMQKCEDKRADVEQALAAHFGRPIPLVLAVDDDSPAPSAPASTEPPAPAPVADENEIDVSELVDAERGPSSVDRVRELFPGAELIDPA